MSPGKFSFSFPGSKSRQSSNGINKQDRYIGRLYRKSRVTRAAAQAFMNMDRPNTPVADCDVDELLPLERMASRGTLQATTQTQRDSLALLHAVSADSDNTSGWRHGDDYSFVEYIAETDDTGDTSEDTLLDDDSHSLAMSHDSDTTLMPTQQQSNEPSPPLSGWPDPGYNPEQPFEKSKCLPENVRLDILLRGCQVTFKCQNHINSTKPNQFPWIAPTFNEGSVHRAADEKNPARDIDVNRFLGNRVWYDDITTIFYGHNRFVLRDPFIAKWWLERIGTKNLAKIKCLKICLTAGPTEGSNSFSTRHELLWCKILHWLKDRQQLCTLDITFKPWGRMYDNKENCWRHHARWREETVLTLMGWRGLNNVHIVLNYWHRKHPEWDGFNSPRMVRGKLDTAMHLPKGAESGDEEVLKQEIKAEWNRQGLKGENYSFT